MRLHGFVLPAVLLLSCFGVRSLDAQGADAPHLEKRGATTQLIVDGKPFLMLAGELHNSSSSSLEGKFEDGRWIPGRRLNGDENDQGSYWRFDPREIKTEKASLYHFE